MDKMIDMLFDKLEDPKWSENNFIKTKRSIAEHIDDIEYNDFQVMQAVNVLKFFRDDAYPLTGKLKEAVEEMEFA